jgi:predicted MFS family arabinose efflux permease
VASLRPEAIVADLTARPGLIGLGPNRKVVIGVMLSMTLGVMPLFFLGAFGPDVQASLGLSEVGFGAIVACYFGVSVLFSMPAGRLGEVRGAGWSISVAAVGVAISLVGIGIARNGWQLAIAVLIGGAANTLTQPGGNMALARSLPPERLGKAFALKQSAIPVAAMIGGFAVPTIGAVIGWRWTVMFLALLGVAVLASARTIRSGDRISDEDTRGATRSLRRLAPLAIAGLCSSAATTGMVAFFVDSAVRGGVSNGVAGVWFALGGVTAILGRLLAGWITDRWLVRGTIAWLLVVFWLLGALGFVLLAFADSWPLRILASGPVFVCGWGWNGTIHHATVQWSPSAPSWGTGVVQTGMSIGGAFGPVIFGALLGAFSAKAGWLFTAGLMTAAAVLVWIGAEMVERERRFFRGFRRSVP